MGGAVVDDSENRLRLVQPKSYTIPELTRLAAEWISEQQGDVEVLKWTFSIFIEWLKRREKELR